MKNNKQRWDSLSMRDKASLVKVFLKNKISGISQMRQIYNDTDLSGIVTTRNRPYIAERANIAYDYFKSKGMTDKQASALTGTIIEESGGDPYSKSKNGTYQGIVQWSSDRYRIPKYEGIPTRQDSLNLYNNQLDLLYDTLQNTTDRKSWNDGGEGSGYMRAVDAHNTFWNPDSTLEQVNHALNWGYVRPKGKQQSTDNRYNVARQVTNKINEQWNTTYKKSATKYNKGEKVNIFDEGSFINTEYWNRFANNLLNNIESTKNQFPIDYPIYQGFIKGAIKSEELSKEKWADLVRQNKVSIDEVPYEKRRWVEGETAIGGADWMRKKQNENAKYVAAGLAATMAAPFAIEGIALASPIIGSTATKFLNLPAVRLGLGIEAVKDGSSRITNMINNGVTLFDAGMLALDMLPIYDAARIASTGAVRGLTSINKFLSSISKYPSKGVTATRVTTPQGFASALDSGIVNSSSDYLTYYSRPDNNLGIIKKGDILLTTKNPNTVSIRPRITNSEWLNADSSFKNYLLSGDSQMTFMRNGIPVNLPISEHSAYKPFLSFLKDSKGNPLLYRNIYTGGNFNNPNINRAYNTLYQYDNLQFIRNLGDVPKVNNGMIYLSNPSSALTNLTYDSSFRTHSNYRVRPGEDYLIIDPMALKGRIPYSIEPMDTFFDNLPIEQKYVTFVSGNESKIKKAIDLGYRTYSPESLQLIYNQYKDNLARELLGKTELRKSLIKQNFGSSNFVNTYDSEFNNWFKKQYGDLNLSTVRKIENKTGLIAGVEDVNVAKLFEDWKQKISNIKDAPFIYPNNRVVYPLHANKESNTNYFYNKLYYDPTTHIESNLLGGFGLPSHVEKGEDTYRILPQILKDLGSKPFKNGGLIIKK